jgi:hypothetical protein
LALEAQAAQLGADPVVGVDLDYEAVGANMLMISASGTAVNCAEARSTSSSDPVTVSKHNEEKSMATAWKIWFALLALASLYGFNFVTTAQEAADVNEILVTAAPQQTVVSLWQLRDLTTAVIYELIVLTVAVASVGVFLVEGRLDPRTDSDTDVSGSNAV